MKRVSISTKVHLPLIIAVVVGFIIVGITGWISLQDMKKNAYIKEVENFKFSLDDQINSKENVWLTNAMQLAKNQDIISAFVNNDRERLTDTMANIQKLYSENTPFKRVSVHILEPSLVSYFQSGKPEAYGKSFASSKVYQEVLKT